MQKNEHNYCSFTSRNSSPTSKNNSLEIYDANNNSSSPIKYSLTDESDDDDDDENFDESSVDDVDGSYVLSNFVKDAVEFSESASCDESLENKETDLSEKTDTTASNLKKGWSLETAFPVPNDFSGLNNPFLTDYELEDLLSQRKHFINQLDNLAEVFGNNFTADVKPEIFPSPPLSEVSITPYKDLKGFKGELGELINIKSKGHKSSLGKQSIQNQDSAKRSASDNANTTAHSPTSQRRNSRNHTPEHSHMTNNTKSPSSSRLSSNSKTSNDHHFKTEPVNCNDGDAKRHKNLNRCLKKLTPTCGFRFPVLDNHLPHTNDSNNEENELPVPTSSLDSGRRGKKRKHSPTVLVTNKAMANFGSDSVRRSHRNRQNVKKFEIIEDGHNPESLCKDGMVPSHLVSAKYNILSLRVRHDNTVDYLIDWCS